MELPVVHLEEGMQDAALHGLESVVDLRNRPVLDEIGGVLQVVVVEEGIGVGHGVLYFVQQVLHDVVPALGRVLAHVEGEGFRYAVDGTDVDLHKPRILSRAALRSFSL